MKIGMIGLGIMGKPMAKNLLKAGYAKSHLHHRYQGGCLAGGTHGGHGYCAIPDQKSVAERMCQPAESGADGIREAQCKQTDKLAQIACIARVKFQHIAPAAAQHKVIPGGQGVAEHSGRCCAAHTQVETKNEQGIQQNIAEGTDHAAYKAGCDLTLTAQCIAPGVIEKQKGGAGGEHQHVVSGIGPHIRISAKPVQYGNLPGKADDCEHHAED